MSRVREAKELIDKYTPLVKIIAGGFQRKLPPSVLREDLIAAGMSGLWDAIRRHPDGPSESFEWYARVRIRGAILDELRTQDWAARRTRLHNKDYTMAYLEVFQDWHMDPSVAARLTDSVTPEDEAIKNQEAATGVTDLARLLSVLQVRDRFIVNRYLSGKKFKEIAKELKISEPRISQLMHRAIATMKAEAARLSEKESSVVMKYP